MFCLKGCNRGCFRQIEQLAPAKQNPVYGHFSKGGRNEASRKFSHLILDHTNDCQPKSIGIPTTRGCELKFPRKEHCVVWIHSSNSDPFPRVVKRTRLK